MIYANSQDISDRYGQGVLDAIDRDGNGLPDLAAVDRALADASALMDTYLSQRYALPLPLAPEALKRACVDIALYQVVREGTAAAEDYRLRYEDAIAWLRDLAAGKAALDLPSPNQGGNPARFTGAARRFTRGSLQDM